jgi:hypothetical protein
VREETSETGVSDVSSLCNRSFSFQVQLLDKGVLPRNFALVSSEYIVGFLHEVIF